MNVREKKTATIKEVKYLEQSEILVSKNVYSAKKIIIKKPKHLRHIERPKCKMFAKRIKINDIVKKLKMERIFETKEKHENFYDEMFLFGEKILHLCFSPKYRICGVRFLYKAKICSL